MMVPAHRVLATAVFARVWPAFPTVFQRRTGQQYDGGAARGQVDLGDDEDGSSDLPAGTAGPPPSVRTAFSKTAMGASPVGRYPCLCIVDYRASLNTGNRSEIGP